MLAGYHKAYSKEFSILHTWSRETLKLWHLLNCQEWKNYLFWHPACSQSSLQFIIVRWVWKQYTEGSSNSTTNLPPTAPPNFHWRSHQKSYQKPHLHYWFPTPINMQAQLYNIHLKMSDCCGAKLIPLFKIIINWRTMSKLELVGKHHCLVFLRRLVASEEFRCCINNSHYTYFLFLFSSKVALSNCGDGPIPIPNTWYYRYQGFEE